MPSTHLIDKLRAVHEVEYRDVPGFPGYRVGDDGSLWSCFNYQGGFRSQWRRLSSKPHKRSGYVHVGLSRNRKFHYKDMHTIVLEAFVGPCPEGMEACHNNGIRSDNRVSNLRWDTRKGNFADKVPHGTLIRGEAIHNALMDREKVKEIRLLYKFGMRVRDISWAYSVNHVIISDILRKKSWAWVSDDK